MRKNKIGLIKDKLNHFINFRLFAKIKSESE